MVSLQKSSKFNQPVRIWSDEMLKLVDACACVQARRLAVKNVGRDEYYQEGCLGAAEHFAAIGADVEDSDRLWEVMRRRMWRLYDARVRRRRDGVQVDPRARVPLESPAGWSLETPRPDYDAILDIRAAIESLPEKHRSVIWRHYREYRSIAELAATDGAASSAMESLLGEAHASLRAAVDDGYNAAERRRREAPRGRRAFYRASRADWSDWGPIPYQRKED